MKTAMPQLIYNTMRGSRPGAVTWLVLLSLIGASVLPADAGYERNCDNHHGSPRGFCGPILSELLSMLCKAYNKRSAEPAMSSIEAPDSSPKLTAAGQAEQGVFLPRHEALSVLQKRNYGTGRITCECCIHKCEVQELKQYCAEPDSVKRSGAPSLAAAARKRPTTASGSERGSDDFDEEDLAFWQKEMQDIADKQRVGRELLRHGPGWWDAVNHLSLKGLKARHLYEKNHHGNHDDENAPRADTAAPPSEVDSSGHQGNENGRDYGHSQ